jgi:hypothetical protein
MRSFFRSLMGTLTYNMDHVFYLKHCTTWVWNNGNVVFLCITHGTLFLYNIEHIFLLQTLYNLYGNVVLL